MQEQGDVFGWSKQASGRALLIVSDHADSTSFPEAIEGIPVDLFHVPEPREARR